MTKKAFNVEGEFQMGRIRQHFVRQIVAADEDGARERAYAELGSRHGVPRRLVQIDAVKPLGKDEASPVTLHRLKG